MFRNGTPQPVLSLCVIGFLLLSSCTNHSRLVTVGMPYEEAVSTIEELGLERTWLSIAVTDYENATLDTFFIDERSYLIMVGSRGEEDQWTLHSLSQWEVGDPNVGKGHPDEFIETELQQWPVAE